MVQRYVPRAPRGPIDGGMITGGYVLVISTSPVSTVVVSRVINECGAKAVSAHPVEAAALLSSSVPRLVILDAAREADFETALGKLRDLRSNDGTPKTILLAAPSGDAPADTAYDIVVRKPITNETLRPAIEGFLGNRD